MSALAIYTPSPGAGAFSQLFRRRDGVTTIPSESVDNSWVYPLSCPSADAALSGGNATSSVSSGIFTSGSSQGFTFEVVGAPISSSSAS